MVHVEAPATVDEVLPDTEADADVEADVAEVLSIPSTRNRRCPVRSSWRNARACLFVAVIAIVIGMSEKFAAVIDGLVATVGAEGVAAEATGAGVAEAEAEGEGEAEDEAVEVAGVAATTGET